MDDQDGTTDARIGADTGATRGTGDGRVDAPVPPDPPGVPPGRAVELPGRGTTFVREAAGPPGARTLLLLHGWTATGGLNWFPSFEPLAKTFRVLAIDHRGHGRGIRSRRRFRLQDCADDGVALADELGIDTFIPVGYSMGGPIAQLLWHRHPDRLDGLVLCATSRNFRGQPIERALFGAMTGLSVAARVTPASWHRSMSGRVLTRRLDPSSELGAWAKSEMLRNDPRVLIEAGHALGRFTSRDWISGVDVPTAVVVTEQDSVVPPHRQHKLAESIAGATVHPVRGDHGVCALDPGRFVPALLEACTSVATRADRRDQAAG